MRVILNAAKERRKQRDTVAENQPKSQVAGSDVNDDDGDDDDMFLIKSKSDDAVAEFDDEEESDSDE